MISALNKLVKEGVAVYSKELEAIAITLNNDTRSHIERLNELDRVEDEWETGIVTVQAHASMGDWLVVQGHDPAKHEVKNKVKEVDYIALQPGDRLLFVIDRARKFIRVDVLRR